MNDLLIGKWQTLIGNLSHQSAVESVVSSRNVINLRHQAQFKKASAVNRSSVEIKSSSRDRSTTRDRLPSSAKQEGRDSQNSGIRNLLGRRKIENDLIPESCLQLLQQTSEYSARTCELINIVELENFWFRIFDIVLKKSIEASTASRYQAVAAKTAAGVLI